jgi:hypothetical protein
VGSTPRSSEPCSGRLSNATLLGWLHEVPGDCDYTGGRQGEELPFYAVQFRLPRGRLDDLAKADGVRDRTTELVSCLRLKERRKRRRTRTGCRTASLKSSGKTGESADIANTAYRRSLAGIHQNKQKR